MLICVFFNFIWFINYFLGFHGRDGSEKTKVDEIPGEPKYQHAFDPNAQKGPNGCSQLRAATYAYVWK